MANRLAQTLKALHVPGQPLLLANVYDAPTAEVVASHAKTAAVATASFAIAAMQGIPDNDLSLQRNLEGIRNVAAGLRLAGKTDSLPLSADLQDGYADIGETITKAIALGVVGANIEDLDNSSGTSRLRDPEDAAARIRQAIDAARTAGVPDFVINARTDVLRFGGTIDDCIARGKLFLQAGATSVFVWGVGKHVLTQDEVRQMTRELNGMVSVQGPGPTPLQVSQLREAGVCRISMGPWFFRTAKQKFTDDVAVFLES